LSGDAAVSQGVFQADIVCEGGDEIGKKTKTTLILVDTHDNGRFYSLNARDQSLLGLQVTQHDRKSFT
jgi:hypothetical protein